GRLVAFVTAASNLVPGGLLQHHIVLRDRRRGTTDLVSSRLDGSVALLSFFPRISADGRFIVFSGSDSQIVANDGNGQQDVFLHDHLIGTTTLLTRRPDGMQSVGDPGGTYVTTAISADGRFAAFVSTAPDLVAGDTNGAMDTFVRGPGLTGMDFTGDGDLSDTVLEVLDGTAPPGAQPPAGGRRGASVRLRLRHGRLCDGRDELLHGGRPHLVRHGCRLRPRLRRLHDARVRRGRDRDSRLPRGRHGPRRRRRRGRPRPPDLRRR